MQSSAWIPSIFSRLKGKLFTLEMESLDSGGICIFFVSFVFVTIGFVCLYVKS